MIGNDADDVYLHTYCPDQWREKALSRGFRLLDYVLKTVDCIEQNTVIISLAISVN
jgi:hypothetical protein